MLSLQHALVCTHTHALHMHTHTHTGWHITRSRFEVESQSLNHSHLYHFLCYKVLSYVMYIIVDYFVFERLSLDFKC